jgi:hypothetical protein
MTPPLINRLSNGSDRHLHGQSELHRLQTIDLGGAVGVTTNTFVIDNGGRSIDAVVAGFTLGGTAVPGQALVHFS